MHQGAYSGWERSFILCINPNSIRKNVKKIVSKWNTEGQSMVRISSGEMGGGFMRKAGTEVRLEEWQDLFWKVENISYRYKGWKGGQEGDIGSQLILVRPLLRSPLNPYFGYLMRRADSFEKTLMLGKIEGRRRRGWQRMR